MVVACSDAPQADAAGGEGNVSRWSISVQSLKLNMNRVFEKLARGSCDDTTTTWSIIKKKTSLGKSGSLAVREGIKLKKHSKQSRNLAARIAALEKQN